MSKELIFSFTKKDFVVNWFSGEGAGGQHRNRHRNCCRITHKETGLVASCQEYKSAPRNKKEAFKKLTKLLVAHYCPKLEKVRPPIYEKATRTYHELRDTITDHVTGKKYSYKETIGKSDMNLIIEDRQKHVDTPEDS